MLFDTHLKASSRGFTGLSRSGLRLLAALLLSLPFALAARADDTVITFDDLSAAGNPALSTEYQGKGLVFDNGNVTTGVPTQTGANAGVGFHSGELNAGFLKAHFTNPHHNSISVWVVAQSLSVGMTVYDPGGNILSDVNVPAGATPGVYYKLQYATSARNIAAFAVGGEPSGTNVVIDDLRYDDIGNLQGPDFFFYPYGHVTLQAGGPSQTVHMGIGRLAGSAGSISGIVSNLPAGVNYSINPNPFGGASVDIVLTAVNGAKATKDFGNTAILKGTPDAAAGVYGTRQGTFTVSITQTYDLRIIGMEVTQGVQPFELQRRDDVTPTAPVSYLQPGRAGVPLAEDGKTSVRVFINQSSNYSGDYPSYLIPLHVYKVPDPANPNNRVELEDSPIYPDDVSGTPNQGQATVTDKHRQGKEGMIATYTLPWGWSRGNIQLQAIIELTPSFFPPPAFDTNPSNDRFTMKDVAFTQLHALGVRPIELKVTAPGAPYPMPKPWEVFHQAQKVHPGPYYTLATGIWDGTIDITDIWNQTKKACGFLGLGECNESAEGRAQSVIARVQDMADDIKNYYYYLSAIGDMIIGIFPSNDAGTNLRAMTVKSCDGEYWGCDGDPVAIVRSQNRPLSSVAHEAGHMLGRNHASGSCDADKESSPFDPWPPDQMGYLNAVGYDWETRKAFVPARDGTDPKFYDIMSYCGNNGGDDPDKWASIVGWNKEFDTLKVPPHALTGGPIIVPTQAGAPVLIVRAITQADGFAVFTKVAVGTPANTGLSDPDSPYHLLAKNANGQTITEVPMLREEMEALDNQFALSANLDPNGVASLEIQKSGTPIARRIRSAHPPVVTALQVQPDVIRAGVRQTHTQWQATDADGDKLMAKVDYSTDNGQTWKPIFFGPNADGVDLAATLFAKSAAGLIRVRVSDGFNETQAISGAFNAVGSPPTVHIYNPQPEETLETGRNVQLLGHAVDTANQPIPDASMKWYEGSALLGAGPGLTVHGLTPGAHTFRLEATDSAGSTGSQKVTVHILK